MTNKNNIQGKNDVFVVTKPLQYINVLNIESNNNKTLILVNSFIEADLFFESIKTKSLYWDEFYFFNNMLEVFEWLIRNKINIETLYIDSDINNKKYFYKLRYLNITVYEEGVGTYRKKHYQPRRKLLGSLYLSLLRLRGHKNRRGGNKYTKRIIVYLPRFYKKYIMDNNKSVEGFKKPFIEHITNCKELKVFDINLDYSIFKEHKVVLFLSSWEIKLKEIKILEEINCDIKIIKPHPHIKVAIDQFDFDYIISGFVPAEIVIINLLKFVDKLYIVSKSSTATIYFSSNPKVEIINLPLGITSVHNATNSYIDAYENIVSYIKS